MPRLRRHVTIVMPPSSAASRDNRHASSAASRDNRHASSAPSRDIPLTAAAAVGLRCGGVFFPPVKGAVGCLVSSGLRSKYAVFRETVCQMSDDVGTDYSPQQYMW